MAILAFTDGVLWIAKYSFQGLTNQLSVAFEVDLNDTSVMGVAYRQRVAGLKSFGVQMDGFWDYALDLGLHSAILGTECVTTVAPTSTVGGIAYVSLADGADYKLGGKVGDAFSFSAGAQGTGPCAHGVLLQNAALTTTTNGTGSQIGALSASQNMYCNLHVTATSGTPTLDVTVQSDDNSGFTTPTTRATFTQLTAAGSAQKIVAGAVTDDYWRFLFTIGGGSPSLTIAAAMGRA